MHAFTQLYKEMVFSAGQDTGSNVLVCVFQRFAADGLNLVVPYSDPNYYKLRPTIAIPQPKAGDAKTAIDLDGQFGLHPSLAPLLPFYQDGSLAVVNAVGQPDHFINPTTPILAGWDATWPHSSPDNPARSKQSALVTCSNWRSMAPSL